ncbi:MAG: ABC transporter substrate-binding protein [Coriobacteriales bacterium]|jgi:ABC-type amino acid transport substrate-binding protein|nr:ABC transporter substrate-binding protein [Coriobacteriales bacterium]
MTVKNKPFEILLAAVLVCSLLLSGCSELNVDNQGNELGLARADKLTIASSNDQSLVTWQDGQPSGFEYDLMQAVADDLGLELNYVKLDSDYSSLTMETVLARYDATATQLGIMYLTSDQYDKAPEVRWSIPYYESNLVCLVSVSSEVTDLRGLSGKVVGTYGMDDGKELPGLPGDATIHYMYGYAWEDSLAALQAGLVDALVIPEEHTNAIYGFFDRYSNLKPIGVLGTDQQYVLIFKPDNSELLAAVNQSLQRLIDDGTYSTIFAKYFSYEPTIPKR